MTPWLEPSLWGFIIQYTYISVCCVWHRRNVFLFTVVTSPVTPDQDAWKFGLYHPRKEERPPQYSTKSRLSWQHRSRGCHICCCELFCTVQVRTNVSFSLPAVFTRKNTGISVLCVFFSFRDFAAGICNKVSEMIQGKSCTFYLFL